MRPLSSFFLICDMQIREVFRTDGPGRVLFMSDLHYGHENILKMSDRPFKSIQEMNEFLDSKGISSVKDIIGTVQPW